MAFYSVRPFQIKHWKI